MFNTLSRFVPLFLIMFIGYILRRREILTDSVIAGLKKIVVTVALPSVLFLSFLTMSIEAKALWLFAGTFILCILLYLYGFFLNRTKLCAYPLSPFFFTGFEFGMVGIALFSGIFGSENLHYILLIGLGHEFFIWFFYAPLLESKEKGTVDAGLIILNFFKSPIIIAILSALFFNLTGLYDLVADKAPALLIAQTLEMLAAIVTPLILLVLGSNLQFSTIPFKKGFHLIAFRYGGVLIGAAGLAFFTNRFVMPVDSMMLYAFITFFLLPPPFIIPVFLGEKHVEESRFYNSILILATVVTLVVFPIVLSFMGMI
ncbi:MAG: AEC family transporter [Spirochaetales bacterium]|nr:AEC family transporter [Spirochaetales bacterium]